jgi:hypothetical protein
VAAGLLVACGRGSAGHQIGHYPSYYPDEIRIDVIDPAAAGKGLAERTLHAYVGAVPAFGATRPPHVDHVKSLGSFLVLSFDAASPRYAAPDKRCAAARGILKALGAKAPAGFVFHPYPVTPYHSDYVDHLDRIEAAKAAITGAPAALPAVRIAARGRLAETIVEPTGKAASGSADVVLEEVAVEDLLALSGVRFDGWTGPPWVKEGWFHAHWLLAPGIDAASRPAVEEAYAHLIHGEVLGPADRANLERELLAALGAGCGRVVVGYTEREEYVNRAYPDGIENIAFDALSGLNSPVFVRTVKLKDYPWNGKLHLGVRHRSDSAWNPVAGFTDPMGRLMWAAIGDPAMIHFPFNASWMPNRVQAVVTKVKGQSGGITVPPDAVRPQPGTGRLERVGAATFSSTKVVYDVLASPFEDGTKMGVADLLYPFAFAYRWGAKGGSGEAAREPRLRPALEALQERLVGIKAVRIDKTVHAIAEGLNVVWETPVLEIYLRGAPGDEQQQSALAPPWSTVPWHLLALMEEAVVRGYAAFSKEEADRRGVPWLDLVRDASLRAKLIALAAEFERAGYRPGPIEALVSEQEARARWRSLKAFAESKGHFLVANGPYRLKQWRPDGVVLEAVREASYPLGFGTFDRFVNPPRAVIEDVVQDAGAITVRASAEMVQKVGRSYQIVKEPLLHTTTRGVYGLLVVSRYLLIGPGDKVVKLDKLQWRKDGLFAVKLPERLPPGQYSLALGIFLDGNVLQPTARLLRLRVEGAGPPG